ncbi:hypothetical protein M2889_06640 [Aeromicrobium sp. zg-Y1362]|nr:hypothetical protein [Aeromicrobium duanguangcaii]
MATEQLGAAGFSVSSAGTDANTGQPLCSEVESYISSRPGGSDFADRHRAKPLSATQLHRSDLILTASPRESSLVSLSQPSLRERTFTLIEADRLLSTLPTTTPAATLADLVQSLHRRRWQAATENWPQRHWAREHLDRRRPSTGLELRDAHAGNGTSHPRLLPYTRHLVTEVCAAISAHLGVDSAVDEAPATPLLRTAPTDLRS